MFKKQLFQKEEHHNPKDQKPFLLDNGMIPL